MNFFVATSYSSQVDYGTGLVYQEYKEWLEETLISIEELGHTVFCALREDQYRINNSDPAKAFTLDIEQIKRCDALLAIVNDRVSAGVQTEIGVAIALGKTVFIAHHQAVELQYINNAAIEAGYARELTLPITAEQLAVATA